MLWQRETQQTTKICWCGNGSATRSRNACLPAPQGPIRLWGCPHSAGARLARTQGTFPPSPLLLLRSFLFASPAAPLCSVREVGAAKPPIPAPDGSLPSPRTTGHRRGTNGFRCSVGEGGSSVQEWNNQFQSPSKDLICLWHINSKCLFN